MPGNKSEDYNITHNHMKISEQTFFYNHLFYIIMYNSVKI